MSRDHVDINIPLTRSSDILSWDEQTVSRMLGKAVELACTAGICIEDDHENRYLRELSGKGAETDRGTRRVRFKKDDIYRTAEVMRETFPLPVPPGGQTAADRKQGQLFEAGNGANLVFDWDKWEARPAGKEDLTALCRWAQGNRDIGSLFPPVMLKDVDQMIEPMYNYALIAKYCGKTIMHEQPTAPMHVKYLGRMARVVEAKTGFLHPILEFEYVNPPFRLGSRAVETMLARVDSGECGVMGIGSMAVCGLTAPVTVIGTAVTAVAEILAALTLFRIMRPGYGLRGNMCTGNLDLRTGSVSYCNMHTHLQNIAGWEMITRGIGADLPMLTWYRDANEPGMQALYEFGVSQSFFSCVYMRCSPEIGGLCSGNTFSPEQANMDMEAVKEFGELVSGFDADEAQIGPLMAEDHLTSDHTLEYSRMNVPVSGYFNRGLPAGARHDRNKNQTTTLMEKANAEKMKAVRRGMDEQPGKELGDELYEYVREAAEEAGLECPELP